MSLEADEDEADGGRFLISAGSNVTPAKYVGSAHLGSWGEELLQHFLHLTLLDSYTVLPSCAVLRSWTSALAEQQGAPEIRTPKLCSSCDLQRFQSSNNHP